MKATIDKYGKVNIEFESQEEFLLAPNGKKYLPCEDTCGRLLIVETNVVSIICDLCAQKSDEWRPDPIYQAGLMYAAGYRD